MKPFSRPICFAIAAAIAWSLAVPALVRAQSEAEARIAESMDVLNGFMGMSNNGIPQAILADAQAVVIVPRVIKGSFIVGARRGEGVVLFRDSQGQWQAPAFLTLTGGNIGWQIGVQATDLVLVFKSRTSVDKMLAGEFTIGADAAAAAGPVGRDAAVATNAELRAEVYSYSRSRGLFAGVSLDGSVLKLDQGMTNAFYQPLGSGQAPQVPASAIQLVDLLRAYTQPVSVLQTQPTIGATLAQPSATASTSAADQARAQVASSAHGLYQLLDRTWQSYLALPAGVFQAGAHPDAAHLRECIARYEVLLTDTKYQALTTRTEFQAVLDNLRRYETTLAQSAQTLSLPSPPQVAPSR
jgi:lipid-binding SYLF domain-containing protein